MTPPRPIIGVEAAGAERLRPLVERAGGETRRVGLPGQAPTEAAAGVDGLLAVNEGAAALVAAALALDLPVLCTGDGMHALNLALGGARPQDAPGHAADDEGAPAYHRIFIAPGSKLAAVVGSGGFVRVNSRHGRGLREMHRSSVSMVSAYGLEDGVIEGIESTAHRWALGVQFQPERRSEIPPHFDRLFQRLVQAAAEARKTTT